MEETGKEKRYSREPEANQIKKRDRRRKKGSLTVEASLVVPLCVMILTFLLSLTFYVYLRCWYTQAACEVSVQGSGYGVLEGRTGQEKAEKKWKTKRSESGFSGKGISGEITGNQKEVRTCDSAGISESGLSATGSMVQLSDAEDGTDGDPGNGRPVSADRTAVSGRTVWGRNSAGRSI